MDEPKPKNENSDESERSTGFNPRSLFGFILLSFLIYLVLSWFFYPESTISLREFKEQVEKRDKDGRPNTEDIKLFDRVITGKFRNPPNQLDDRGKPIKGKKLADRFRVNLTSDEERTAIRNYLEEHNIRPQVVDSTSTYTFFLVIALMLPMTFIVFMWIMNRRAQNQMLGGGGFLSGFSKSPAKRYESSQQQITFNDVAGIENVKADLMEIVEYLKEPDKFQKLGGRVPKGVLLNGPPGTGKTLLARAVAGEADVPFYSVNGSEFIQMFVGVGASRVRDLFGNAKETAPSIIFIDEIDAVGRQRGAGLGGGHDEREQTLNQILSEMDGFSPNDSVIVLAATNRPDILDPALLRPGRFDRHVTVNRPTRKGRLAIFKVHVRDVPLSQNVDLDRMASGTVGLTGADIRNIVNEAALWAARHDKNKVEMDDFEYARDKVLMGAKRDDVLSEEEKEKTAYHEAGHALAAWSLKGAHRVHKVSVIPRGRSLGVTQMLPGEDRMNMSKRELLDNLIVLLAGRAAEDIVYDEATVGAENDLERATGMARRMVTHWGMSERLGPVSYKMSEEDPFLGKEIHEHRQFSEHTMEIIDEEVGRILHDSAERAEKLLTEKRSDLNAIAEALVSEEEIDEDRITELIGQSIHEEEKSNGDTSVNVAAKESVDDATK